jgi:hypothetical protein
MSHMFAANIRICIYGVHVFNYYIVNNANCTRKLPYVCKLTTGCGQPWLEREELERNQYPNLYRTVLVQTISYRKRINIRVCVPRVLMVVAAITLHGSCEIAACIEINSGAYTAVYWLHEKQHCRISCLRATANQLPCVVRIVGVDVSFRKI